MLFTNKRGFTLLEILLVVAAIGILAAVVIVAINPNEQLSKIRNSERQSEVNTLYNAIQQYNIDNNGEYPSEIANLSDNEAAEICADGTTDPSCINLTDDLTETYISQIPSDPQSSGPGSGYVVSKEGNRIRIEASNVELENEIIAAGYDSTRLLDDYPFAAAAYSIRLLNDSYETTTAESGNDSAGTYLVRIRKDNSNNDTADVLPDSNGELSKDSTVQNTTDSSDGQTLDTWVGSNNAYVTTWYDQSGNGNDAINATKAEQPQIVSSGSVVKENGKPALDFDGSDDGMNTSKGHNPTISGFAVFRDDGDDTENSTLHTVVANHVGSSSDPGTGMSSYNSYYSKDYRLRSQGDDVDSIFGNGSDASGSSFNTKDVYTLGSFFATNVDDPSNNFKIGKNARTTSGDKWNFDGIIQEIILYNSDQSSNRTDIESDINDFFSIY